MPLITQLEPFFFLFALPPTPACGRLPLPPSLSPRIHMTGRRALGDYALRRPWPSDAIAGRCPSPPLPRLSSPSTPSPTFSLVEKRRRSPPSPTLTLEEKGKKDASISAGEEGEEGDVKPPAVPSKRTRGFLATRRPRPLPPPPHPACGYRTSPAEPTSIQIQGNSSVFSPRTRPLPLPSGTGLHLVSFVNHRQDALTG